MEVIFVSDVLSCFNSLVDCTFENIENIKRQYGVIKKLIPDTDSAKVKVKIRNIVDDDLIETEIENDPDEKNWLTLLNKTKQKLKVGDAVWVYYWRTITDGYVAIKIGKPTESISGKLGLERAMAITDKSNAIRQMSQTVSSFEIKNKVTRACDNTPNVIYVCGCPAVYYPNVSNIPQIYDSPVKPNTGWTTSINNFKQFIIDLDDSLFIKDIQGIYIGNIDNTNYKKVDIHFGVYDIWGGITDSLWATNFTQNYNNFNTYYNTFTSGKSYRATMMYNMIGSDSYLYTMMDGNTSWGRSPSDYYKSGVMAFTNYADALNGGFIYVYDKVYLNGTDESAMSVPYGYLVGKWVYKSFVKGKLLTPDPSLGDYSQVPYIAGEQYLVCSCDGNSQNKGGFAPIFSSHDEREYVRQTLSRIESAPY